jgi:hypothetical protein
MEKVFTAFVQKKFQEKAKCLIQSKFEMTIAFNCLITNIEKGFICMINRVLSKNLTLTDKFL